jgi:hypothetical protein
LKGGVQALITTYGVSDGDGGDGDEDEGGNFDASPQGGMDLVSGE